MKEINDIEKSIQKTYKNSILAPFVKAICDYNLVSDGDKIAVCVSGGKDSLLLSKLFQELKRHNKFSFEVEFMCMDPGFLKDNRVLIESNCQNLNIPIRIFDSDIFSVIEKTTSEYPCYMCARMRRGFLYKTAKDLGCNKIALAHHMDDVIETTLMNMFYGSQFMTMVPKLDAENYEGMELIRPLFYIREKDIIRWQKHNEITAIDCGCVVECHKYSSKRYEVKMLINELEKIDKKIPYSIFHSAENINLEAVLGYKKAGIKHNYEEIYSSRKKK